MANSTIFSIDGEQFEIKLVGIARSVSSVTQYDSSSPSDGVRHRHEIGKYLEYTLTFPDVIPQGMEAAYQSLYDKLTELADWHTFILPFNNSLLSFEGSVEDAVSDRLVRCHKGSRTSYQWGGLTFTIRSRKPYISE